jgi:hypothetical protein
MEGWLGYTVLGKCLGGYAGGTCPSLSIERVDATHCSPNVGKHLFTRYGLRIHWSLNIYTVSECLMFLVSLTEAVF